MPEQTKREENVSKKEMDEVKEFVSGDRGSEQGLGEISKIIGEATIEKENKRKESFLSQEGVKSFSDLTDEQKEKFNSYELSKDELTELAEKKAKEMYDIYYERNRKLNNLLGDKNKNKQGKIDKEIDVYTKEKEERENEIKELETKIEQLEKEGKEKAKDGEESRYLKQDEIDELRKQIEEKNSEISNISGKIDKLKDFRESCIHAMGLQKDIRNNMEAGLRGIYGPEVANQVISKNTSRNKNMDDQSKENVDSQPKKEEQDKEEQANPENEVEEQTQENNPNTQQQRVVQQGAPGMGIPMGAGFVAQQAPQTAQQVQEEMAQPNSAEVAAQNLKWIGYDPNKALTVGSAKAILKNFVNEPDKQLDILKDPDSAKVIFNAMEKAESGNFLQKIGFGKTKKALLKAAEEVLPKEAAEEFKRQNPDYLYKNSGEGQEYGELVSNYDKELKKLEERYAKEGKSEALKKDFDALDKKYAPIIAAMEFRGNAIKTLTKSERKMLDEANEKKKTIKGARGWVFKEDKDIENPEVKQQDNAEIEQEQASPEIENQMTIDEHMANMDPEKQKMEALKNEVSKMSPEEFKDMIQQAVENGDKEKLAMFNNGDIELDADKQEIFENTNLSGKDNGQRPGFEEKLEKIQNKNEEKSSEKTTEKPDKENLYTKVKRGIEDDGFFDTIRNNVKDGAKKDAERIEKAQESKNRKFTIKDIDDIFKNDPEQLKMIKNDLDKAVMEGELSQDQKRLKEYIDEKTLEDAGKKKEER